jgi:YfiH family protein
VGDDAAHVAANRIRVFERLDANPASIHDVWLVHGTDIVYAPPRAARCEPPKADILFTDNPEVSLFMRFADCVPLLFHDPKKNVIGIAHAGWMGTLQGVAGTAIQRHAGTLRLEPADVVAGIGPSIGVDHYEVGEEVAAKFEAQVPRSCRTHPCNAGMAAFTLICGRRMPVNCAMRVWSRFKSLAFALPAIWMIGSRTAPKKARQVALGR